MMDGANMSGSIYKMLMQAGIRADGAGTPKRWNKKARSSANGDALAGVAGREERSPIYLAWVNPTAMRRAAGKSTARLMIV